MVRPIVTLITDLKKPCLPVEKNENIKSIIQDLKDTLEKTHGLGISANQIGIQKKISYIKVPKSMDQKTKKIEYGEYVLINPKMIEHNKKVVVKQEGCISFPGLKIDTDRWIFITLLNHNEKLEPQTLLLQDLESIVIQHEYSHLIGRTIIDDKHKTK